MYKFFVGIIIYLVIISSLISFVVYESMQGEMEYIALDGGISSDRVQFSEIDDYIDARLLDRAYWDVSDNQLIYSGRHPTWSDIMLKGIVPDEEGYYNVQYDFNNPQDSRIRFVLQKGGALDRHSYYAVYTGEYLVVYEPSARIPILDLFKTELLKIPISLSGLNQSITTRFHPITEHIELYHHDIFVGDCYGNLGGTQASHYGGIGVYDNHLVVTAITADIHITTEPSFTDLFLLIGTVLVYTIDEKYFPFIFNLLLIKLPIAVLIIGLAFWVRGVS